MAKRIPDERRAEIVTTAQQIGVLASARHHQVSPQSVVTFCKERGISLKRVGESKLCAACGRVFVQKGKHIRKHCSRECRSQSERPAIRCSHCGVVFHEWASAKRKYCSAVCYHASRRLALIPRKRRGANWKPVRKECIHRHKGRRATCGTADAKDVHHVIPFKFYDGDYVRANHSTNLVLLCQQCHITVEKIVRAQIKLLQVVTGAWS